MKPISPLAILADPSAPAPKDPTAARRERAATPMPKRRRWYDDARIVWRGSNLLRVATVLHSMGQPAYMHVIATKSGLSPEDTGKVLSRLYKKNYLTREKSTKVGSSSYFRWSMSDEQYDVYLLSASMTTQHIDTELRSVFAKLRLLQHFNESSVFGNNPVLDAIIDDYRCVWRSFNSKDEQK
jgi:predicted transcriptional regulator